MSKDPTTLSRTNALTEYEMFLVRGYEKRRNFWLIATSVAVAICLAVVVIIGGSP